MRQNMYDKELAKEILVQINASIHKILRRFESIHSPDDFIDTEEGQDKLDAICMQLIAIGESLKNIDKITNKELLSIYPAIEWKKAKGLRDIITHHYFDLDAEIVFSVCQTEIPKMESVIKQMIQDLN